MGVQKRAQQGEAAIYIPTEGNFPLRGRSISILFIHFRIWFALHRIRFNKSWTHHFLVLAILKIILL